MIELGSAVDLTVDVRCPVVLQPGSLFGGDVKRKLGGSCKDLRRDGEELKSIPDPGSDAALSHSDSKIAQLFILYKYSLSPILGTKGNDDFVSLVCEPKTQRWIVGIAGGEHSASLDNQHDRQKQYS